MICDKVTYNSYKEALKVITGMRKHKKGNMRSYKCNECGKFHISTIKPNQVNMMENRYKYQMSQSDIADLKPAKKKVIFLNPIPQRSVIINEERPLASFKIRDFIAQKV